MCVLFVHLPIIFNVHFTPTATEAGVAGTPHSEEGQRRTPGPPTATQKRDCRKGARAGAAVTHHLAAG